MFMVNLSGPRGEKGGDRNLSGPPLFALVESFDLPPGPVHGVLRDSERSESFTPKNLRLSLEELEFLLPTSIQEAEDQGLPLGAELRDLVRHDSESFDLGVGLLDQVDSHGEPFRSGRGEGGGDRNLSGPPWFFLVSPLFVDSEEHFGERVNESAFSILLRSTSGAHDVFEIGDREHTLQNLTLNGFLTTGALDHGEPFRFERGEGGGAGTFPTPLRSFLSAFLPESESDKSHIQEHSSEKRNLHDEHELLRIESSMIHCILQSVIRC